MLLLHPSSSLIYERGYLKLLKWFWWGVRRLVGKSGGNWHRERWWIFDCIESNLSQSLFLDGWQICKNLQNYVPAWHINIYPACASCFHTCLFWDSKYEWLLIFVSYIPHVMHFMLLMGLDLNLFKLQSRQKLLFVKIWHFFGWFWGSLGICSQVVQLLPIFENLV